MSEEPHSTIKKPENDAYRAAYHDDKAKSQMNATTKIEATLSQVVGEYSDRSVMISGAESSGSVSVAGTGDVLSSACEDMSLFMTWSIWTVLSACRIYASVQPA